MVYGNGGCCCCWSNLFADDDNNNLVADADADAAAPDAPEFAILFAVDGQSSMTICDSMGLLLGSGAAGLIGSMRHGLRAARRKSTAESIFLVFLQHKQEMNIYNAKLFFLMTHLWLSLALK